MMKKSLLTACFIAISLCAIFAQVPKAFKYQAVVRDMNGIAIADQSINLRISIIPGNPDREPVYSETHQAITNGMGLVNLEIGRGINPTSEFASINWSQGEFYIKLEIDENGGTDFKAIGVSQLLSVPYALHSGTAESITGAERGGNDPGVPSYNWSLFGNSGSNPPTDKLGTTDFKYISVVTNNIERMKIWEEGDIDIWKSLTVGENLTVQDNVTLNAEHTGGATINRGAFTVSDLSPTTLSGTLTVDGASVLNSSLDVYGITNLHSNFNVLQEAPSYMTGVLTVDKDATFNKHVYLMDETLNSLSTTTGALVVKGGVGIGKNLYVGGNAVFNGPLAVTDATESTSTTTGALTVVGGVGIGKRLNVGGATAIGNNLSVSGQVSVTANPGTGNQSVFADYPLIIQGGEQGMAIKVNGERNVDNNFISFWDANTNQMWGRIEGQSVAELENDDDYKTELIFKNIDIGLAASDFAIGTAELVQAVVQVTCASTSTTVCAGLGACITGPIPSLIVSAGANLILKIANLAVKGVNLGSVIANKVIYTNNMIAGIGVTYQSGSGDYAEWLPKLNTGETFVAGELVGVKNGFVTKSLYNADKVMVVSTNPIILGNMPEQGRENDFVKIAFMGQVPVRVFGEVKSGDYIVPSELNNGFGRAINPDKMGIFDYRNIVGVAWSDMLSAVPGINVVNVAVGINSNDLTYVIYQQEQQLKAMKEAYQQLESRIEKNDAVLADLLPGYSEATGSTPAGNQVADNKPEVTQKPEISGVLNSSPEDILYFEFSEEEISSSLDVARETYISNLKGKEQLMTIAGLDQKIAQDSDGNYLIPVEEHPFWKRLDSEPGYREAIIQYIKGELEKNIYTQRKYAGNFNDMKLKE